MENHNKLSSSQVNKGITLIKVLVLYSELLYLLLNTFSQIDSILMLGKFSQITLSLILTSELFDERHQNIAFPIISQLLPKNMEIVFSKCT